jgi:predicted HTH transcriptional regulator
MKYKAIEKMPKITFHKKYFEVLDLLGAEPEMINDEVVCNELDLKDAVTNLEIHIEDDIFDNDEVVFAAIDKLGIQPYHLLAYLQRFMKAEAKIIKLDIR